MTRCEHAPRPLGPFIAPTLAPTLLYICSPRVIIVVQSIIKVVEKIEDIVQIVFLPLYFTLSGLKTNIFSIASPKSVLLTILVLVLASVGKMAGCTVAARLNGVPPRESLAVGVLMNTRG